MFQGTYSGDYFKNTKTLSNEQWASFHNKLYVWRFHLLKVNNRKLETGFDMLICLRSQLLTTCWKQKLKLSAVIILKIVRAISKKPYQIKSLKITFVKKK